MISDELRPGYWAALAQILIDKPALIDASGAWSAVTGSEADTRPRTIEGHFVLAADMARRIHVAPHNSSTREWPDHVAASVANSPAK
jgi:hypothetical protein